MKKAKILNVPQASEKDETFRLEILLSDFLTRALGTKSFIQEILSFECPTNDDSFDALQDEDTVNFYVKAISINGTGIYQIGFSGVRNIIEDKKISGILSNDINKVPSTDEFEAREKCILPYFNDEVLNNMFWLASQVLNRLIIYKKMSSNGFYSVAKVNDSYIKGNLLETDNLVGLCSVERISDRNFIYIVKNAITENNNKSLLVTYMNEDDTQEEKIRYCNRKIRIVDDDNYTKDIDNCDLPDLSMTHSISTRDNVFSLFRPDSSVFKAEYDTFKEIYKLSKKAHSDFLMD